MSWYISYYIGYEEQDSGIIKPYGPFTCEGKLKPAVEKSRSFASDLYKQFIPIPNDCISDELRKYFEYEDWEGNKKIDVKYLNFEYLPNGHYIKSGYFPIEDVKAWEENDDDTLFYHIISPTIYAEKMKNELTFGKNQPKKDDEGDEYTELNASDYMYYAAPDYNSKEYEVFQLLEAIQMLDDSDFFKDDNKKIVILETEG